MDKIINIGELTTASEIRRITDCIRAALICIDGEKEGEIHGKIQNCYLKSPISYYNLGDLILKLDEMCNWLKTPHYAMEPRFFNKETKERYWKRVEQKKNEQVKGKFECLNTSQTFSKEVKTQKTLLVKIEFRQNASLQGYVMCKSMKGQSIKFRSALELMRMIKEM